MPVTSAPAPPRVLHVTQPVDGGVARVVADLVRGQLAAGMHVSVACPASGSLPRLLASTGCEVLEWEASRSPGKGVIQEGRRLAGVVARTRPDLIHAHSAKAGLITRLVVRGRVPTVFQPHAWSFEAVRGVPARMALNWERLGARWASRLVCVSRAEQRTGRSRGIEAEWRLVPNGVDLERFHPAAPPDTEPHGSGDGPLVVCVGRLCRQKGQDLLVRAWKDVLRELPRARLVLVGDGPEAERLKAAAPRTVSFAGPVDDPVPWYRAADLVVMPSRWEGMALAPLEAMACGSPVLVTDVAGARESLPPPLARACVVPPEDTAALARALVRLLRDTEGLGALGRAAYRHVHAHHDVRRTAAAVAEVYGELLGPATTADREPITT
ncbi:glycosyltransferase family 4 protein [Streptomyces kunmingensis]|uniref:Glycosyltransferase family 4 protein n=1 Tax=Streptomyces kunmingensis TaxID=68225 RepID=A0ABU6C4K4_9ACTN|nr:glycosyltransferase family 4 protein [Streptomyces kunmingensis]MEB3959654.1 glycosyltransferase family 4 protein [Streptomyces kunmingensis]